MCNANQKAIEDLDNLLDILVAECYSLLAENKSLTPKQILKKSINKLTTEPSKLTQGSGIIDRQQVTFFIGDDQELPLFSQEVYDDEWR